MDEYESLSHSKWECKYHIVFIEMPQEGALWQSAPTFGRGVPEIGRAKGVPD